jgi:hypothetical protein
MNFTESFDLNSRYTKPKGASMLDTSKAYSGFAVDDTTKAKEFYE